jgi:hypothetical protein
VPSALEVEPNFGSTLGKTPVVVFLESPPSCLAVPAPHGSYRLAPVQARSVLVQSAGTWGHGATANHQKVQHASEIDLSAAASTSSFPYGDSVPVPPPGSAQDNWSAATMRGDGPSICPGLVGKEAGGV